MNHGGGEVKSRFCEARDHELWIRHLESGSGFEDQTSQIRTRIRIRIICSNQDRNLDGEIRIRCRDSLRRQAAPLLCLVEVGVGGLQIMIVTMIKSMMITRSLGAPPAPDF